MHFDEIYTKTNFRGNTFNFYVTNQLNIFCWKMTDAVEIYFIICLLKVCIFLGFLANVFVTFVIGSLSILTLFFHGISGLFTVFTKYLLNVTTNWEFSETKFVFSTNAALSVFFFSDFSLFYVFGTNHFSFLDTRASVSILWI